MSMYMSNGVGSLNEKSLHFALKNMYFENGDTLEEKVDGYVVDVVKDDELVEIQTRSFSNIKKKLNKLLDYNIVRLVHPLALSKTIETYDKDGKELLRSRKSPKKASVVDAVRELVYIPDLVKHQNFRFELLLTHETEVRHDDGLGSWRRKGVSIADHKLEKVERRVVFNTVKDYLGLLPEEVPDLFTNKLLVNEYGIKKTNVHRLTNFLRKVDLIQIKKKNGREYVFQRC